jgi:hypothetical protein
MQLVASNVVDVIRARGDIKCHHHVTGIALRYIPRFDKLDDIPET